MQGLRDIEADDISDSIFNISSRQNGKCESKIICI